jgi:hypothetical protein
MQTADWDKIILHKYDLHQWHLTLITDTSKSLHWNMFTYVSPAWGYAAETHANKLQTLKQVVGIII